MSYDWIKENQYLTPHSLIQGQNSTMSRLHVSFPTLRVQTLLPIVRATLIKNLNPYVPEAVCSVVILIWSSAHTIKRVVL